VGVVESMEPLLLPPYFGGLLCKSQGTLRWWTLLCGLRCMDLITQRHSSTNQQQEAGNCSFPLQTFFLDCKIGGGFKYVPHPTKTCSSDFWVLISCNELGILFVMPQQTFWLLMFSSCVIYMLVIPSLSWNQSFYVAIIGIFGYVNNVVNT
jgi:hypothetical protein